MMMRIENLSLALFLIFTIDMFSLGSAQLRPNYYANICPNVENIVRNAVTTKFQQTFATVPSTIRLFYHDCFVQGCDASIVVASTPGHKAEKDHPENLSIAGDGFDTVIKAKAAVDAVPECRNKVSCADILAMATRDVIALAGGPSYAVELGRLDGLSSTSKSVTGKLPKPEFDLNQLNSLFAANGLSQTDMIALSAAHTVGFSHCSFFAKRIQNPIAPTLNKTYGAQLQTLCQQNPNPNLVLPMDSTSNTFDNQYFKDLQQGRGLFNSDQSLFTDSRSRPTVNTWAQNSAAFNEAFITAITKWAG